MIIEFTRAYMRAIYFCDTGDTGQPERDAKLSEHAKEKIESDCRDFLKQIGPAGIITEENVQQAGHDFWLTRNGHGTGFWDTPPPFWTKEQGEILTALSQEYGEIYIAQNANGFIDFMDN